MTGIFYLAGIVAVMTVFWAILRWKESARASARAEALKDLYKMFESDL